MNGSSWSLELQHCMKFILAWTNFGIPFLVDSLPCYYLKYNFLILWIQFQSIASFSSFANFIIQFRSPWKRKASFALRAVKKSINWNESEIVKQTTQHTMWLRKSATFYDDTCFRKWVRIRSLCCSGCINWYWKNSITLTQPFKY